VNLTRIRPRDPRQNREQRRLPSPVRPNNRHKLTRRGFEVDSPQHLGGAVRDVQVAARKAEQNGWRFQRIGDGEVATLDSVTLKMLEDVQGTKELTDVRGIVVYPDAMCEPA